MSASTDPATRNAPEAVNRSGRTRVTEFLAENGALVGLVLVALVMFIATPKFLTTQNLLNVGVQAAVTAILAFGMTFVIVTAGIDLSVGSLAALSAICAGWAVSTGGLPGWLALIVGPLVGLIAGAVSGVAIAYGKLPAFIATLAMLSIARGLTLVVSGGRPIEMPGAVTWLGANLGPVPVPIVVMIVTALITSFILTRTVFGRSLYAIGGNEEAARLAGLPVKRTTAAVYALSGLFAAIAGLVLAGRLASAQPQAAAGYELDAIAAVVIGGASLSGGVGEASLNVTAFWQQVVIGVVIALAVGIDVLRHRR